MKQFKKVLAFVLALAMVVTAVPTADAKAAAKAPKLNNTKKILYVGQSYTLKIGNLPANWKKCTYAWSASNKNVTVKKGKYGQAASVKANKAGTATVTVKMTYPQTAAQKKAKKKTVKTFKCVVTVKNPSVKFTTTADRIEVGETAQFTAKATPSTAKVTYSSSDAAVATVDATGLVTAVANGTATIKATAKVGTKTVSASKTVEVYTAPTEAKQTKVKEITITSGKVVTKESKIAVKKGSVEVALAEKDGIAIDATGKTVVLTTASKLTKGEYTVTIDDATANFTAEDEKVTAIEFTSDKAVLDAQVPKTLGSDKKIYKTAKAAYKVYNQFKEDITADTTVTVNGNGAELDGKGTIKFTSSADDGFRLNDIVSAVVIYNQNGIAVTKSGVFTVSNEAAVTEISIKEGFYNKKGEAVTVTEDTDPAKDKIYVLVSAKDQYGREMTALTNDGNVYVQVAGGLTNLELAKNDAEEITVAGVKYAGFQLKKDDTSKPLGAGSAIVLVISKGTGVTAQGTLPVANGGKVDTITVQVPDLVVGREDTKLGYTAVDSYGKEVTSISKITAIDGIEDRRTVGKIWAKENPVTKKAELYYTAESYDKDVPTYDVETLLTSTYKSHTVQLTIKKNAEPTAITKTKDLTTGAREGDKFTIVKENIVVVDQYGRAYENKYGRADTNYLDDYDIYAYCPDEKQGNNAFALVGGDAFGGTIGLKITEADKITAKNTSATTTDSDSDGVYDVNQVTAGVTTTDKDPVTKVRFVLAKEGLSDASKLADNVDDGKNVIGTYDVTFTAVKETNFTSYEVKDLGTVYAGPLANTPWNKTFDVKGVNADGVKANIPATDYSVTFEGEGTDPYDGFTVTDGKITTADLSGDNEPLKDKETTDITLTFTFKDGAKIQKTVTLSKAAPKVATVEYRNGVDHFNVAWGTSEAVDYSDLVGSIKAVDQYGAEVENVTGLEPTLTFYLKDKDGNKVLMDKTGANGTVDAKIIAGQWITGMQATVDIQYPNGGAVFAGCTIADDTKTAGQGTYNAVVTNGTITVTVDKSEELTNNKVINIAELLKQNGCQVKFVNAAGDEATAARITSADFANPAAVIQSISAGDSNITATGTGSSAAITVAQAATAGTTQDFTVTLDKASKSANITITVKVVE